MFNDRASGQDDYALSDSAAHPKSVQQVYRVHQTPHVWLDDRRIGSDYGGKGNDRGGYGGGGSYGSDRGSYGGGGYDRGNSYGGVPQPSHSKLKREINNFTASSANFLRLCFKS